jgi:hypothetical protein
LWNNIYSNITIDDLVWFWFMAFNATFNNISVKSWRQPILVLLEK